MGYTGNVTALKTEADRVLRLAAHGTVEQIEAHESNAGEALSNTLDGLWGEAEHAGEYNLARKLERAFNVVAARRADSGTHLTWREED